MVELGGSAAEDVGASSPSSDGCRGGVDGGGGESSVSGTRTCFLLDLAGFLSSSIESLVFCGLEGSEEGNMPAA